MYIYIAGSSTRTYKGIISWFKISRDTLKFPSVGSCIHKYVSSFHCTGTRKGTHIRACTGSCTILDCSSDDLRLNLSPIPVQIVESRGAPSSYAVLKKFHGLAW